MTRGAREQAADALGTVAPWAPFGHRAFAVLWAATLVSNIGTWMHDVGAGWLMTTLSPSPAVVALVQAATTLPVFLFALLAGALADRLDKRAYLITVNTALAAAVAALALLTALDRVNPVGLLAFTFVIGTGAAFLAPAWQAVVPALVPRNALQQAIALNSLGVNVSRAVGPALAGFLIAAFGLAMPFALNAASFLVIIAALLAWQPAPAPARTLPPEPLVTAMLTGLRHAGRNAALKATLWRVVGFFPFASAYWALLPLVVRDLPGGGAELYGILLAAIGAGAVAGALALPWIRRYADSNRLAAAGTLATAAAMGMLGLAGNPLAASAAAALGGMGWITMLTSIHASSQTALPNWVRARGLAVVLMANFGSMAAGSALWGLAAAQWSVTTALLAAAAGAVALLPLVSRARLGQGEGLDLAPSMAWSVPVVAADFDDHPDRGPVLVTVRYVVDEREVTPFLQAVHELSGERYRDGAYEWGVCQDAAEPRVWVEWFLLPSWAEHLRQHERVTHHDLEVHGAVRAFHRGDGAPEVHHYLAPLDSRR